MDMMNRFRALIVICAAMALAAAGTHGAAAQNWGWSDEGYSRGPDRGGAYDAPPYGQRPVYGQPGYGQPAGAGQPGGSAQQQPYGQGSVGGSVSPRCRELELQLTGGAQPASSDQLPKIDADMRQADASFRTAQGEADRATCYDDMFLFGRSLKRTPRCIELDGQVQRAKATLSQLKAQRDAIVRGTSPRGRHDEIIADLARNRCGDQYTREHDSQRGRLSSIFSFFSREDEDSGDSWRTSTSSWFGGGGSAYRTLCVRECDGFYFPVSTATTESKFAEDEAKCHTQCAAPAELYHHRMDQDVEQMVSLRGVPYSQMPNAFRNRKVYIRGCSCNASEYSREEIAKSEEALKTSKRADAGAGGKPAGGSDSAFARRIGQAVQNAPAQPAAQPAPAQPQGQPVPEQSAPAAPPAAQPAPPPAGGSWTPGVESPPPPAANPAQ